MNVNKERYTAELPDSNPDRYFDEPHALIFYRWNFGEAQLDHSKISPFPRSRAL
jgi:hypothetical protein